MVVGLLAVVVVLGAWQFRVRGDVPSAYGAWLWLRSWWPAVGGGLVLLVVLGLVWPRSATRQPHDWSRTTAVVSAFTAVAALVFTALSLDATREQVAVSEQAQITDRFTKAVEQVGVKGADRVHLRIGGIYALERVADDSERDRPAVVELLSAFIRDTSPRLPDRPCDKVAPDVQAAFTVLGRRPPHVRGDPIRVVDLRGTCLVELWALDADLTYVVLGDANLDRASLGRVKLGPVTFNRTSLRGAHASGVDFRGSWALDGTDFTGATLGSANFEGVDLSGARFEGADLTGAKHNGSTKTTGATKDSATKGAWW
nr:hypothetical protein GCM10017745_72460 [Saccharothrix mutabilis subsp. capreolus]